MNDPTSGGNNGMMGGIPGGMPNGMFGGMPNNMPGGMMAPNRPNPMSNSMMSGNGIISNNNPKPIMVV